MELENLFDHAVQHRNEHDCSAYPYENYQRLIDVVNKYGAEKILEVGTGMGFTSTAMALQNEKIHVDTIEKDAEHLKIAQNFIKSNGVEDRVNVIEGVAETVLAELPSGYDLIFFDGFQIHYEFLAHYERLLKAGGILFLANNHLQSKTSTQFFEELQHFGKWKTLDQFADTTISQKL